MIFSREFQYDRKVAKGLVKVYAVYLPENFEAWKCAQFIERKSRLQRRRGGRGDTWVDARGFSLTSSEKRTNCWSPGRRETLGDSWLRDWLLLLRCDLRSSWCSRCWKKTTTKPFIYLKRNFTFTLSHCFLIYNYYILCRTELSAWVS